MARGAVIDKYLARYAADESAAASAIGAASGDGYEHVCVIPAMAESAELLAGVSGPRTRGRWLCVVVVNAPEDASASVYAQNRALLADLRAAGASAISVPAPAPMFLSRPPAAPDSGPDVLVIDRSSPGHRLPAKQGVGLARRIGGDVALALIAAGTVRSRWIHMTDADVTLPDDYFEATARAPAGAVAATYRFWHEDCGDPLVDTATGLYEVYLRYHRLGLLWAGSPYRWHTIGSTLAVTADAYAAVRGVPRRSAGEDFYLVDKLVKLGQLFEPATAPISIRARRSDRVPFGTGAATNTLTAGLADERPYCVYHPRVYALLRAWLGALRALASAPGATAAATESPRDAHVDGALRSPALTAALRRSSAASEDPITDAEVQRLTAALCALGAPAAVRAARAQVRPGSARERRLMGWFDGYRTFKLIHALRDSGWPSVPWQRALEDAPFSPALPPQLAPDDGAGPAGDPHAGLRERLRRLRQALMAEEQRAGAQ
ncbi:MAG: hypothetical protein Tsb0020_49660 [Haliangiales bacterium]